MLVMMNFPFTVRAWTARSRKSPLVLQWFMRKWKSVLLLVTRLRLRRSVVTLAPWFMAMQGSLTSGMMLFPSEPTRIVVTSPGMWGPVGTLGATGEGSSLCSVGSF